MPEPRLSEQFKQEVQTTHQLNHVEPTVKQVLPTASDVVIEKREVEFRKSIEEFDEKDLHHVKPIVKERCVLKKNKHFSKNSNK